MLGIAGVGLIGASIGLRARELGWRVIGWDREPAHVRQALAGGAISAATNSLRELATAAEILVLATPLDATLALLKELTASRPPGILVLDVASVKTDAGRAGAALPRFVATHPIAGSERSGPGGARGDLFVDRVWTYDAAAPAELRERAVAFIRAMGAFAFPIANAEHDRILAFTSHLPQVLSVALGARLAAHVAEPDVSALCGTGIRSMLRLAVSPWSLWHPVLRANSAAVAEEVRALADILHSMAAALDEHRSAELEQQFQEARAAAERLGENGAASSGVASLENVSNEREA